MELFKNATESVGYRTLSLINCFLIMVLYHSNRKVAKSVQACLLKTVHLWVDMWVTAWVKVLAIKYDT